MIYALNYANDKYKGQQKLNTDSAIKAGKVDKVFSYNENDLQELKEELPEHFKYERGNGLWVWKPYLVLKTLEKIEEGDYLFYADSGSIYIDEVKKLIPDLESSGNDIMVFELPLLEKEFTKKETFYLLNYHNYSQNQILATFFLIKKTNRSIEFMKDWLEAMKDIRVLSARRYLHNIEEFPCLKSHREDQSVFSILCRKRKIEPFRDPSDFGIFPWQYMRTGSYRNKKHTNSHYPTIMLCIRKNNPQVYEENYYKALRKYKMGLNNEFIARIKLLPMYMRHWGRILFETIGLGKTLDKIKNK